MVPNAGASSLRIRRARALIAGLIGVGGAVLLAWWFQKTQPLQGWFFFRLAAIWLWQLYFIAACTSAGFLVVTRLVPAAHRSAHTTIALAFPSGIVVFILGMYLGGFLHLFGPGLAVLLPAVMLLAGAWPVWKAWRAAQQAEALPELRLTGLPLVLSIVGVALLGLLYLGVLSPAAVNYDAAWMHLTIAQDYAREGHIVGFPGNWVLNVPHVASIIYTWSFIVPGFELPALKWMMGLHTEFVVVVWTFVGVAAAARWLAERKAAATWTVFLLFPALFSPDGSMGGAADHFAGLFAAPLLLVTGAVAQRFERGPAVLWGAFAGAALVCKAQAMYFVVPLAVALLIRGAALARASSERRAVLQAFTALGISGVAVALPYLATNVYFFHNPLYPLAQSIFTASTPTFHDGAAQADIIMADWNWRPRGPWSERLSSSLAMIFTFSFKPHYSFMNDRPTFGSVFTASLPLLFVIQRPKRLWFGAGCAVAAVLLWALTYRLDRNLGIVVPIMMAATAALLLRTWELGWVARLGISALVLIQLAWGSALYTSLPGRIAAGVELLRSTFDGQTEANLRSHRHAFVALGQALPKDATVMMHTNHESLGIDRPVVLDIFGFQGVIDYRTFSSGRDLYDRLRELGVTHVTYYTARPLALSVQEEIIFDLFVDQCARSESTYGLLTMFAMPAEPPPQQPVSDVLLIGVPNYADGIYPLKALTLNALWPPEMKSYPAPAATAPVPQSLVSNAQVVLTGSAVTFEGADAEQLARDFRTARPGAGLKLWVRR